MGEFGTDLLISYLGASVLKRVFPNRFNRMVSSGRTKPLIITCDMVCEDGHVEDFDVVTKFSHGCDMGNINLAREVIGVCLAGDLSLPVPEPFLVETSDDFINSINDSALKSNIYNSSRVAFGSKLMHSQFSVWSPGRIINNTMLHTAASIFVFDCIIQNPDRRIDNPNCLVRGDEFRIFDHELAFSHGQVLFWKPPWENGGLNSVRSSASHIFYAKLRNAAIEYEPIRASWEGLSDDQIADYESVLPPEWGDLGTSVSSALRLIRDARDNINAILNEVRRVLS